MYFTAILNSLFETAFSIANQPAFIVQSAADKLDAVADTMDEAVKKFPEDVVSAYQQENRLIFRLKQINFPSGKSELPAESTSRLGGKKASV